MKYTMKHIALLLIALLLFPCFVWADGTPSVPEEPAFPEEPAEPAQPKKLVALTFDDGPDSKMTAPVLDILEKYGVRATFFLSGSKIKEDTAPLVERAVSLGCEISCHGWDHRNMMKVSLEMTQKQIRQYFGALEEYVHVPVSVMLVRPPGGHSGKKVKMAVGGMGLGIITWDVDSEDWKYPDKEIITKNVFKKVKDGSVILMHDRHQPTADALELIIPRLIEEGYELVTVSEVLTRNGDPVEPGEQYTCMPPAEQAR